MSDEFRITEMRDHVGENVSKQEKMHSQKSSIDGQQGRRGVSALILLLAAIFGGGIGAWITLAVQPDPVITQEGDTVIEQRVLEVREDAAVIEAVKKVSPAVVSVVATQEVVDIFGQRFTSQGGGTGFIVTNDGLILTNKHVVEAENTEYVVVMQDGTKHEIKEIQKDPFADIAFLRIDAENLPIVQLGDSDGLQVGQQVIAIGNALAEFDNTVTTGVVSALNRSLEAGPQEESLEGVIQTDATINPGNSGGPLLDASGNVIGINTAIILGGEQIGFAIPINDAKSAFDSVVRTGEVVRPILGVRYVNVTPELQELNDLPVDHGILLFSASRAVPAIVPGGPAAEAGLKEGDILLRINNQEIQKGRSITRVLAGFQPGEEVEVAYLPSGETEIEQVISTTLTLGSLSSIDIQKDE